MLRNISVVGCVSFASSLYSAEPLIIDDFTDGNLSNWTVFDDITPDGGTFSVTESHGVLNFVTGGGSNFESAGIKKAIAPTGNLAVSFTVYASYTGVTGNKRTILRLADSSGGRVQFMIGKDKANEWHSQFCVPGSCSAPALYGALVNQARATYSIHKMNDEFRIFRNNQLVYTGTYSMSDVTEVSLGVFSGFGANNAHSVIDDFVLIAGE